MSEHLLQDQDRGLTNWFAGKPDARLHAREAAQAIGAASAYDQWRDFYGQRVTRWMTAEQLREGVARMSAPSAPSAELLLVHAMRLIDAAAAQQGAGRWMVRHSTDGEFGQRTGWLFRDGGEPCVISGEPIWVWRPLADLLAKTGHKLVRADSEPMVRFCPGCGHVGSVATDFRDCCPDGSSARMIPAGLASKCGDLSRLALEGARYLDGVNVPSLIDALVSLGHKTGGQEETAAALADHVNALSRSVISHMAVLSAADHVPPVLVRDVIEAFGVTFADVINALIAMGCPLKSVNSAISGETLVELAKALKNGEGAKE